MHPANVLRDRFALWAMNGLLGYRGTDRKAAVLAHNAYEFADAMLAARGTSESPLADLRDRIAEMAMNGLLAAEGTTAKPVVTARMAFEIADAMIAGRKHST